ncbi:MAG TPA: lipopolysaccharide assembly protein LapB [Psychromonas sp.]
MLDYLFLGFLFLAIIVGFFLGRKSRSKPQQRHPAPAEYLNYYKGLSYLFNEQPDSAIDAFIGALDVNSNTLETHLALGNMLRRRGEVTKAIKIHQNLLARPGLSSIQRQEAQLELARDYIKSGLLDRAESLLLEIVKISASFRARALEYLIEVYQDEKEWTSAIKMASQLNPKRYKNKNGQLLGEIQAHFACEQACIELEKKQYSRARQFLADALNYDKNSVRASLLFAKLECDLGRYRDALKYLHKIPTQEPELITEALDLLCDCYDKLAEQAQLIEYLMSLLNEHPSNSLIIKIAERLRWQAGDNEAAAFIAAQLKIHPSIRTLNRLIEFYLPNSEGQARENLFLLKQLVDKVISEKPGYCCSKCGFTGNTLHWLCPGCKSWGSVRPIRGVAGE